MIKTALRSILAFGLLAGSAFAADTYNVDHDHSNFLFKIQHLGVSNTIGRFNEFSGTFSLDTKDPSKSSISLTIQTASVDSNAKKRDDHLRSPDFFDATTFPTLTFVGKTYEKVSDTVFKVTGDVTLHGVTKPLTITITKVGEGSDPWGGFRQGWSSSFTLKRSDFGMNFMQGGIGDEVSISVEIEGVRK